MMRGDFRDEAMKYREIDTAAARAIASALDGAPESWAEAAMSALVRLAKIGLPFTAYDVQQAVMWTPPEPRAIGGIFKKAARSGLIKPTGQYVVTDSMRNHGRPERQWVGRC